MRGELFGPDHMVGHCPGDGVDQGPGVQAQPGGQRQEQGRDLNHTVNQGCGSGSLREATKKVIFFRGMDTKALPPPPPRA